MPRPTEQRIVLLLKVLIWMVGLGPVAWLIYGWFQGNLGVNPIEKVILVQGRWTLVFLLAAMAVTPIRRLTGWNRVVQLRRLVGLFAFFHASLHFLAYAGLDQFFEWPYIVEDVIERPYITAGFTAFVLLLPLAVTSTRGWIRRLGKRWQRLHRLAYVAAALGVLHFFWKVKADTFWPLVSALLLAGLFGIRVWHRVRQARQPRRGTSPPVAA